MIVDLKDVTKSYGDISILKKLNLSLDSGKSVTILGHSGSGKSTLLSILGGTLRADGGEVNVLGNDLLNSNEDSLSIMRRKKLGMIFQHFHLINHLNAYENVLLPLEIDGDIGEEQKNRAKDLLSKVGLADRLEHFPSQLSGGEKQRVAIARALVHNPDLILADEPSGSLDEETGKEVMDLVFKLVEEQGKSLILVTHNKELGKFTDRVMTLDKGVLS
ncbi:MAG: ABC transporter ATP-binding protein [Oligoflexia bacterium]|nr:ABC transporter ATP-binding protein [Oligoflexia bacterium]